MPDDLDGMGLHLERAGLLQVLEKQLVLQKIMSICINGQRLQDVRRPTEWVSPKRPSGASALRRPRRIFSSLGNGGKKSGGGGCPGSMRSGIFGGADVNALRLCAYARSSG